MKKNDWILLISIITYTVLFYEQWAGINFLIFSLILIILTAVREPVAVVNPGWIASAAGSLFTGFFIMWYGNKLSVIANLFSLAALAAYSFNPSGSYLVGIANSVYSFIFALPAKLFGLFEKALRSLDVKQEEETEDLPVKPVFKPASPRLFVVVIPVLITAFFFMMYQSANPLFYEYTKRFSFEMITWNLIGFMLLGTLLMYGYFRRKELPYINEADREASDALKPESLYDRTASWIGKMLSVDNEILSGVALLVMLNLLLFSVNILDAGFLWGGASLPEGMTYSRFVHQGTETIIFSVVSAIAIILFYFRGELNFNGKNKTLRILTYIWIIQNVMIIISTCMRNHLYIEEYGLTYKRIGVDVYLLLTTIGLVTTLVKVGAQKSNWFLFRKNSWAFYAVLVLSVAINWDMVITDFNMKKEKVDIEYLGSLGYSNLPQILKSEQYRQLEQQSHDTVETDYGVIFKLERIDNKAKWFIEDWEATDWRSWCYTKQQVYNELKNMKREGPTSRQSNRP